MNPYPGNVPPGTEMPVPAEARQGVSIPLPTKVPTVTYWILGITILTYVLQWIGLQLFGYSGHGLDPLELYLARINELIRQGEIWRFITPVLLHASITHILVNMYALYSLGMGLERYFGHGRFLLLYLLGGFSGNVLSFLVMPDSSFSVGASTSLFGLIAAEGVFLYQNRRLLGKQAGRALQNVVLIVVVNFLLVSFVPGIDMYGHIGGLIGGLIFAWFAGPRWEVEGLHPNFQLVDRREGREVIFGAALVLLLFGGLAIWGMMGGKL